MGEINGDSPDGFGIETSPDGFIYKGKFKDGDSYGQGSFTLPNGDKFVGEMKNGEYWSGTGYDKDENIIVKYVNGVKQ